MTTLLFLPADDSDYRWWRIADSRVVDRGEGVPAAAAGPVIAVPPSDAIALHWAELPGRSVAQAGAAARILAAEASAAAPSDLHVAIGDRDDDGGAADRPIAIAGRAAMAGWLADLARFSIDPVAMVPGALLLPRPDGGFVRGDLAGQSLVRGRATGFADESGLTELVTAGEMPVVLTSAQIEDAVVAATARLPLDLRQGPFARRRRRGIDWRLVRRLALFGLAILALTLLIDLVRIVKYSLATDALEARANALAATGLPRNETVTDADRQLSERLSQVRGPGLGYSTIVAVVYDAVRAVPGTELNALDFQTDGTLRLGIACEREALATDLKRAMEARGLRVRAGVFQAAVGRVTGEFTVSAS